MKVLFLGEIVGRCGIGVIKHALKDFCRENCVDFVIADAEGATGGFGLGFGNAQSLHHMGIDVLTMGEKSFFKIDMVEGIEKYDRVLRPANYPEDVPGRGVRHFSAGDKRVCVINMLGMMGFSNPHLNNPFLSVKNIVEKAKADTPFVFVVFHSQATAEKVSMGYYLDGCVSAVVGAHTKVLTADARILPKGTAYITDLGRCGASDSVGGFDAGNEIKKYSCGLACRSSESWEKPQMQGLLCSFNDTTGFAESVKIIRMDCNVPVMESKKE